MRPDALHNFPSVVSPHAAEAAERTGLHIPSTSLATSGCLANHCAIDPSEVADKSPAPDASAFATIGLGCSEREQFVAAVKPTITPPAMRNCLSRFTLLFASDYHLMISDSESSVVAGCRARREELLSCGRRCGFLLNLCCLVRLLA